MSLSVFCQAVAVNGLLGVNMSTIERRFALSSSQSAWIAATYEISGVPALLVIGYLGMALHRPAWIGGGLIMLGVGYGIFSIPHFAAAPYRYGDTGDSSNLCLQTAGNSHDNASLTAYDRYINAVNILASYIVTLYRTTGKSAACTFSDETSSGTRNMERQVKHEENCSDLIFERRFNKCESITMKCLYRKKQVCASFEVTRRMDVKFLYRVEV